MPDSDDLDPAASTQMFQAFVDRTETEESGSRWMRGVWAGLAVGVVAVLAWVLLS